MKAIVCARGDGCRVVDTEQAHGCHANGCSNEAHEALPFCKHHFNMLPEKHRQRMWKERRRDKDMDPCAACYPGWSDEVRFRRSKEWDNLYHLGLAILLKLEYGGCGAPDSYTDEKGFCWACGIQDDKKHLDVAGKVIVRFGLRV